MYRRLQSGRSILNAAKRIAVAVAAIGLLVAGRGDAQSSAPVSAELGTQAQQADSLLQDRTFESKSLARVMKYRILLPVTYLRTENTYPVLYLLHGWHGDYQNWSTLTKLTDYAQDLSLIIVMPDANDSWYVNAATNPQDRYETFIAKDLVAEIDSHWRTMRSAEHRAIAGLSMGGYGAVKFAEKFPEVFRFAGSISGAFNAPTMELAQARADLAPSLQKAYGAPATTTRADNDVYKLLNDLAAKSAPYFYIDCGSSDTTFLPSNRALAAALSNHEFAYEYHEFPGSHSWQYWDTRLSDLLKAVMRHITSEGGH
jgi:putative tributyrin esterase